MDGDLVDWADVAALALMAFSTEDGAQLSIRWMILRLERCKEDYEQTDQDEAFMPVVLAEHQRTSEALREAFEAGRADMARGIIGLASVYETVDPGGPNTPWILRRLEPATGGREG